MLLNLQKVAFVLACLACVGQGRRIQLSTGQGPSVSSASPSDEVRKVLATLLLADAPASAFNPAGLGPGRPLTSSVVAARSPVSSRVLAPRAMDLNEACRTLGLDAGTSPRKIESVYLEKCAKYEGDAAQKKKLAAAREKLLSSSAERMGKKMAANSYEDKSSKVESLMDRFRRIAQSSFLTGLADKFQVPTLGKLLSNAVWFGLFAFFFHSIAFGFVYGTLQVYNRGFKEERERSFRGFGPDDRQDLVPAAKKIVITGALGSLLGYIYAQAFTARLVMHVYANAGFYVAATLMK